MKSKNLNCFLIVVFLLSVSCGDESTSPSVNESDLWGHDEIQHELEWNDDAVYFDSADVAALHSYNEDSGIVTFYLPNDKAESLEVGDVIILHGKAIRKVQSLSPDMQSLVVSTEQALLVEAVKNGTISWDYGVDFNKVAHYAAGKKHGDHIQVILTGDTIINESVSVSGYDFSILMVYQNEQFAKVKLVCQKKISGNLKGSFEAEGIIKRFRSTGDINIENSQISKMNYANEEVNGELTLALTVTASGNDNLNLELPVQLLPPIVIPGPIPIMLNIKVLFLVNGVVPLDGSSRVEAKFKYDSRQGFKFNGVKATPDASAGDWKIDKNKAETGASSPIGINFGLAFPRLEISAAGDILVPWIHTAYLIGGDFTTMPPCQQAKASFIGACGLDISFAKIFKYSKSHTLWNHEKILLQAGDCP